MIRIVLVSMLIAGCASTSSPRVVDKSDFDVNVPWESDKQATPSADDAPSYHSVTYELSFGGKKIGEAGEVYRRSEDGVRILRTESMLIERGTTKVPIETEVTIDADTNLRATRVEIDSKAGAVARRGTATRADDGAWVIALDGERVRRESSDAVPAELIPYLLKAKNLDRFDSEVLLAGYGFAVVPMRLRHEGQVAKVVLETAWGDIKTTMRLDVDGTLVEASAGTLSSTRVNREKANDDFEPPEVLTPSSIALSGVGTTLRLEGYMNKMPDAPPGVVIREQGSTWDIEFKRTMSRAPDVVSAINREVGKLLDESHDAPGADAKTALKLGRGDCSAHAALFVDLATERGLDAKVVTGFRVDDGRLVRHRWVTVNHQNTWIEVDPTFGESPVPARKHVPLAVHGTSSAEMALVDEAIFRDLSGVKASWVQPKSAMR